MTKNGNGVGDVESTNVHPITDHDRSWRTSLAPMMRLSTTSALQKQSETDTLLICRPFEARQDVPATGPRAAGV